MYVIAGDMQVIQRGRESQSNNIDVVYVIDMQAIQREKGLGQII